MFYFQISSFIHTLFANHKRTTTNFLIKIKLFFAENIFIKSAKKVTPHFNF